MTVAALGEVIEGLRRADLDVKVDEPLGPLTTYRVGGPAAVLVTVGRRDDLAVTAELLARWPRVPVVVIGRGSNLLVADRGFPGVALQLAGEFEAVTIEASLVRAGGAAALPVVARLSAAAGLRGFEWAVGVPGSIGGAVRMNAGGHGSDMAASLREVHLVDLTTGEDVQMGPHDLRLGYRSSSVGPRQVVHQAVLELRPGRVEDAEAEIRGIVRWRREHQPGGPNAGSVFTNPPGDSAGRLIDVAGCKGLRVGTAEVSTKHANFIQVDPGGRAADVVALMDEVARRVLETSGVALVPETRLIGFEEVAT